MPAMIDSVSRFSPGNCEPELLESMLVGRHDLATRLEKSVLDGIETGAGHHWLLVGPRGVGKTHLLAILFNRVNAREAIRQRVAIAYMKEEERGVASYLDWLVRILRAFDRRSEASPAERLDLDLGERLEALKGLPLERAAVAAERLLLEFVGERRVLLIAENLGELFSETKGMGRSGQQKLRDLLQQHPVWTVIASTQALFEDVQSKEAPFYGFFKVRHLGTLSIEEAVELLSKLAVSEGRHELTKFFRSEAGQGRIRAIHEITGGNPRLLVIFYQFVDRESIEDLARPFLEMVDNLTSYYQEQMQPLPALQQKILEFLCEHRSPATVKEIARSCFISHQTASAQLRRLAERRYVQSTAVGRESYYELREPLFRICFEVKENLGYPIRLFVDFLGKFYSMEELRRKHRSAYLLGSIYEAGGRIASASRFSRELVYLEKAITTYHKQELGDPELQPRQLDGENVTAAIDDLISHGDYREATKLADAAFEQRLGGAEFLFKSATGYRRLGDLSAALNRLQQLVEAEPENHQAWIEKGNLEVETADLVAAEASYRRAVELNADNGEALIRMGHVCGCQGNHETARQCFDQVIKLRPADADEWFCFAFAQDQLGDVESARVSYAKATELGLENESAWFYRGFLEGSQGDHETARQCFEQVTRLLPNEAAGWFNLARAQEQLGDVESARVSYAKATELGLEDIAAWFSRGVLEGDQGDQEMARRCFEEVIRLGPEDADEWFCFAFAQGQLGDVESARVSFAKATELDPEDEDAWLYRGVLEGERGDYELARQCFEQVTRLRPNDSDAWYYLAVTQEKSGNPETCRRSLAKALELAPQETHGLLLRAELERLQNNREQALGLLRKAESSAPKTADFFNRLGGAYQEMGLREEAIERYRRALELEPAYYTAHFKIVLALFEAGDLKQGMEQLGAAVHASFGEDLDMSLTLHIAEINTYLLLNAPSDRLTDLVRTQKHIFDAGKFGQLFAQGFIGTLTGLLRRHRNIPRERLIELRDGVVRGLGEVENLSVVCRLFTTGVRYLESGDQRVLLELPLEERSSLEKLLQAEA